MDAPVYTTLNAAPAVVALLKADAAGSQLRVYPAGEVPQGTIKVYLTYSLISGQPENHLNQVPQIDDFSDQIDIYGITEADVIAVGKAVRNAIEPVAHIISWLGISREPDTKLYRLSCEVEWFVDRI